MNYRHIISDMEWSYSRLTSFEDCKYRWLLQYVMHKKRGDPQFFATYGTFMHEIMEKYLGGELSKDELVPYFLEHYDEEVSGNAPSQKIADGFFEKALAYLRTIDFPYKNIAATEKKVNFKVGPYNFVGYIDVLAETDSGKGTHIIDHKSHGLLPRSKRKVPTVSDRELDSYLRQQYLYSKAIKEELGEFPQTINFNCYRHGRMITEPFDYTAYEETLRWAEETIEKIMREEDWNPSPDAFKCNYICDMKDHCEFCPKFKERRGGR